MAKRSLAITAKAGDCLASLSPNEQPEFLDGMRYLQSLPYAEYLVAGEKQPDGTRKVQIPETSLVFYYHPKLRQVTSVESVQIKNIN